MAQQFTQLADLNEPVRELGEYLQGKGYGTTDSIALLCGTVAVLVSRVAGANERTAHEGLLIAGALIEAAYVSQRRGETNDSTEH